MNKFTVISGGGKRPNQAKQEQTSIFNQLLSRNSDAFENAGLNVLENRVMLLDIYESLKTNPVATVEDFTGKYNPEVAQKALDTLRSVYDFENPPTPPAAAGALLPEDEVNDEDQRLAA